MPVQLFTAAERARRNRFPETIAHEDLLAFFTLSERDLDSIPRYSAPHNRLGYALQVCALRFMGFVPDDLTTAPPAAVAFLAQCQSPGYTAQTSSAIVHSPHRQ